MALTPAEQTELDALNNRVDVSVSSGLTPAEQVELNGLNAKAKLGNTIPISTGPSNQDLFNQIGRNIPPIPPTIQQNQIRQPTPRQIQRGATPRVFQAGRDLQTQSLQNLQQKRNAFEELIKRGNTPEDIRFALEVKNRIEPIIPRGTGKFIGDVATGLVAGQLIPGPADEALLLKRAVGTAKRAGLVGLGAAAGETAESLLRGEGVPKSFKLAKIAAEAAGFQGGSEGVVAGGRKLLKHSQLVKKAAPLSVDALEDFRSAGGVPSPTMQDRRLGVQIGESLSRGSLGGGDVFRQADLRRTNVIGNMADDLVGDILGGVDKLEDAEVGRLISDMVQQPFGTRWTMVDDLISPMYDEIDELAKFDIKPIFETVNEGTGLFDSAGKEITKQVQRQIGQEQVGSVVKTSAMRNWAKNLLNKNQLTIRSGAEGSKGAILTASGKSELEKIVNLPDKVGFGVMRDIRSGLLKRGRQLAFEKSADAGIVRKLGTLSREALFDPGLAAKVPPEARKLLQDTTALYRQASQKFEQAFSKNMVKRITRNPAKAAKSIINTNDAESLQTAKEVISGRPVVRGKDLVFLPDTEGKEAWKQLTAGHFANVINEKKSVGAAVDQIAKLDPKVKATLYDKGYLDRMNKLKEIDEASKFRPQGTGLFAKGLQLGLPASGALGAPVSLGVGGVIFATPVVYAEAAKSPALHKLLVAGLESPPRTKQSAVAISKFVRAYSQDKIKKEKSRAEKEIKERLQKDRKRKQTKGLVTGTPASGLFSN